MRKKYTNVVSHTRMVNENSDKDVGNIRGKKTAQHANAIIYGLSLLTK